jgi:hypothetical protein
MRNANWSFRLRLHSGLRQSGSRFAVAFYGPTEVGPFRVRSVASDDDRGFAFVAKGQTVLVSLASSGSFDCADHDSAVICFAQDDGVQ